MNLIEKFENMPNQDVRTFNNIFKNSLLQDFSPDDDVKILGLVGGKRRVLVNDVELLLDLSTKKLPEGIKNIPLKKEKKPVLKAKKKLELPDIYRKLRSSEFMVYCAIKEVGEIHGVEEFSRHVSLSNKTIALALKKLTQMKLVTIKTIDTSSGRFTEISISKN